MHRTSVILIQTFLIALPASRAQAQATSHYGSICGVVTRASTVRPVATSWVSIWVASDRGDWSKLPSRQTAADGSFCFRDLPPGQYLLLPHKEGFVPAPANTHGAIVSDVRLMDGKPPATVHLALMATSRVSQLPDDALNSMFTPEQRKELDFEGAAFSPDGRYLAFVIGDILDGEPEQAWRYDFTTHQLIAITAKPEEPDDPMVDGIGWIGDTLYTAAAHTPGGLERKFFVKTQGDTTTEIPSLPMDLKLGWGGQISPLKIGPYTIELESYHGGTNLVRLQGRAVIARWIGMDYVTALSTPPTVIYDDGQGIVVSDLKTLHHRTFFVPNYGAHSVLAARRTSTGIQVAYSVAGPCQPPQGLVSMMEPGIHNSEERSPGNLCVIDLAYNPMYDTSKKRPAAK